MSLQIRNICVPTDFSDGAEEAVQAGVELAKQLGAKLHLVHVLSDIHEKFAHPDFTQADTTLKAFFHALEHGATENLARLAAKRAEKVMDIDKVFLYGDVADAVLHYVAKNAIDLLIVGHHNRGGATRHALGSATQKIVRDSPVPVMCIPYPQPVSA